MHTRLAGICGSDLSLVEGHASTYFDDYVSFPFVPGHEVVGELDDGSARRDRTGARSRRARASRRRSPTPRPATATTTPTSSPATSNRASRPASAARPAADGRRGSGPTSRSSTASPTTCPTSGRCSSSRSPAASTPRCSAWPAIADVGRADRRRARRRHDGPGRDRRAAALRARRADRRRRPLPAPDGDRQGARRRRRGAGGQARPRRAPRGRLPPDRRHAQLAVRTSRSTPSAASESITDALRITRPRGRVVLLGMPADVRLDLTGLWHRETELKGAYTYGTETTARRHARRARSTSPLDTANDYRGRADAVGHLPARRARRRHRPRRRRRPPRRRQDRLRSAREGAAADAPSWIRARGRPLDAADPVLARRGVQPREAARRPHPGDLPARAAGRASTTSTARSATPCSTRSTWTRCRRCCSPT